MKYISTVLLAFWLGLRVSGADAAMVTSEAYLDALQSVPSNGSVATGVATVVFDTTALTLDLTLSVVGISLADITFPSGGLAFGAIGPVHIHREVAGTNGPVVVPFADAVDYSATATGFDLSTTGVSFDAALLPDIASGGLYLNVHTIQNPSGEIRGQLSDIPLPATLFLMVAGLLAMAGRSPKF